jgi:hypothetical protein
MISEILFEDNDDCPICYSAMLDQTVSVTPCGHHFHNECLMKQFESGATNCVRCAMCRREIFTSMPDAFRLSIGATPRNISDIQTSGLVESLTNMPTQTLGARRTQMLLATYIISADMLVSSSDIEALCQMQRAGMATLVPNDIEQIDEFVGFANALNRGFRQNAHRTPTFRDLAAFLNDSHITHHHIQFLWCGLFGYGNTRGHDGIQSPVHQSHIDQQLSNGVPRTI